MKGAEWMSNINKKRIGENLNALAKYYGYKIKDFEEEAGVSQGYISRLSNKNSKDSNPVIDLLMLASEKFRVTIDSLVYLDFKKIANPEKMKIQCFLEAILSFTDKGQLIWERNLNKEICTDSSTASFVCNYDDGNIKFYIFELEILDEEYPGYTFFISNKENEPSQIVKYNRPGPVLYDLLKQLFEVASSGCDFVNIDESADYAINKFMSDNGNIIDFNEEKKKYFPLRDFLKQCSEKDVVKTFYEIEEILGEHLPASAWHHQTFWANNSKGHHPQCKAWLDAGYEVVDAHANTIEHRVHFRKIDA